MKNLKKKKKNQTYGRIKNQENLIPIIDTDFNLI